MRKRIFLDILVIGILLISGCIEGERKVTAPQESAKDRAISACKQECNARLIAGEDFTKGPCLSNEIIEDWVCDVAHDPRQDVDNMPENQCSAFRERKAHHFVELDTECNLIKAW
ncbi:MAG: hypothetical protein ACE5PM_00185 [Candidatus Hydrothermarchaeales archaeon]